MSTTYKIISGDTFESISIKQYGVETESSRIARANPGVVEPLTSGTNITIPVLPNAPKNLQQQSAAVNNDEVTILIEGNRFEFWDSVRVTRSIDTIDVIEFGAPFDSDLPGFKETFRPFSYKDTVVTIGGEPLFTGVMVSIVPNAGDIRKIITVSCYSLPGVLSDCTPPASSYPLEFNGQVFSDIVTTMVQPFGIGVNFKADQGAIFERVAAKANEKIFSFLTNLAKQRNLILANDTKGNIVVWQSITSGNPIAKLQQGESPVLSVTPLFSAQDYYSHITGIESVQVGLKGSQFTVRNERLSGVVRPLTFSAPDTIDSTIKSAVEAKAARMFGNIVSYSVTVATWRDSFGNLWEPNKTITLIAPDAMIYNDYEFIIRSVEFNKNSNAKTAKLNLVLPGSFSGQIPETLPWD